MTVTVIDLSKDDLRARREGLLATVRCTESELRRRVLAETATADERATLVTLDEITFLLNDDR